MQANSASNEKIYYKAAFDFSGQHFSRVGLVLGGKYHLPT